MTPSGPAPGRGFSWSRFEARLSAPKLWVSDGKFHRRPSGGEVEGSLVETLKPRAELPTLSQIADSHFCFSPFANMFDGCALARATQCATPGVAVVASCPAGTSKPPDFKMEFKMSASTKQVLVAIALTLGVTVSMPLSLAFSPPAQANTAIQNRAAPPLRSGDLVRLRSGGPLMTVIGIEGDQVNCAWTDRDGHIGSERFPIAALDPGIRILRPFPNGS